MKNLLITGFERFGGDSLNPSWEAVRRLPEEIGNYSITKLEIPVVFALAGQKVLEKAEEIRADAVICVGLAGGRNGITVEYSGLNLRYARIPDNAGNAPEDEPVADNGPAAIFSTLPVRRIETAIRTAGIRCAVSYSAGTYVCNDVLYTVLYHYRDSTVPCGFIHVPYTPDMDKEGHPCMPLEEIIRALTIAVECL